MRAKFRSAAALQMQWIAYDLEYPDTGSNDYTALLKSAVAALTDPEKRLLELLTKMVSLWETNAIKKEK